MMRKTRRPKKGATESSDLMPQFSAAFVAEVAGCDDIATFQDLLERKGLWLNRRAAEGVFGYLHAMSDRQLRDEDLLPVVGGVSWSGVPDDQLVATLQILSDQLNGML